MKQDQEKKQSEITLWTADGKFEGLYPDHAAAALRIFGSDSEFYENMVKSAGPRDIFNGLIVRDFDSLPPVKKLMIVALDEKARREAVKRY